MTNLFDATLALAEILGDVVTGTADSGTTAKLVDAALDERAGILAPGTLFLKDCTQAALDYTFHDIIRHDQNTLHFATLSATITAADPYAAFPGAKFALRHLIKAINRAVQDLKSFTQENATLTTVANQEEYQLPAGVSNVVSVEIAKSLTSPYNYSEHRNYKETNAGYIRFFANIPGIAGYKIRVGYNATHSELSAATDTFNPGISMERLKYEAAAQAWTDYLLRLDKQPADDLYTQAIQNCLDRAAALESHNILRKSRLPALAGW